MIILDTNVVSEPMRSNANPAVAAWLDRQAADTLFLTATSLSELLLGIELLPPGQRRIGLSSALGALVGRLFAARILPFDEQAAQAYAILVARARGEGIPISVADGQIAAIAVSRGFAVASRDTLPFVAAGAPIIDPWDAEP
jgi:hypothetical protein